MARTQRGKGRLGLMPCQEKNIRQIEPMEDLRLIIGVLPGA
jgi:hypothetical protein